MNSVFFSSSRDDLLTAVEYLIKNESTPLDFILIETNGLADPSAVRSSRNHLFLMNQFFKNVFCQLILISPFDSVLKFSRQ